MNRVALVTGGAKRVGRAVALSLARSGMDIAITYHHSETEAQDVIREIHNMGRQAIAIQADFATEGAAKMIHQQFTQTFQRLDALINNASTFEVSPFSAFNIENFDRNMRINAFSPLALTQVFSALLATNYQVDDPATTGRIVNFIDSHIMGDPLPDYICYNASKAALLEITRSCALELAPNITVNAVAPGVVAWAPSYTAEQRSEYLQRVLLGRAGITNDAALAVCYLVNEAHYCTGEILRVDGGRHLA